MPEPISDDGEDVLGLWRGSFLAAAVVGALVWGLIVWAAIRYRRRNDDLPSQTPENIPIELSTPPCRWSIVLVLFGFTVVTQERVTALADDPDVVVDVTAFQWSWTFGLPRGGRRGRSDGVSPPELVVPVGATVRFELDTVDVAHSFWVPELLTKRDMLPDVDNAIDVEVDRGGSWTGPLREFCGLEHHAMLFTFTAVEPAAFDDWLEERRAAGDVLGRSTRRTSTRGWTGDRRRRPAHAAVAPATRAARAPRGRPASSRSSPTDGPQADRPRLPGDVVPVLPPRRGLGDGDAGRAGRAGLPGHQRRPVQPAVHHARPDHDVPVHRAVRVRAWRTTSCRSTSARPTCRSRASTPSATGCTSAVGLTMVAGFLTAGGPAATGWTLYAPLSQNTYSPSIGTDLVLLGLVLTGFSAIFTAVNVITTVFTMRAPGMTMFRLPVFTWNMVVVSLLVLTAFPLFSAAAALLFVDRNFGGHVFDPSQGGSAILWQHLFWFFGHPEVYIVALPFFGVITEVIPVFSWRPVFGYKGIVFATLAIAALSVGVWAHHMFTTGRCCCRSSAGSRSSSPCPPGSSSSTGSGPCGRGASRSRRRCCSASASSSRSCSVA
jgi:heme/copper-type cytochrome/quinol oxidase subunit 2